MSQSLAQRLRARDPATRAAALLEVARQPDSTPYLHDVADALGDADKTVSRTACRVLIALDPKHSEVRPLLRRALASDDADRSWCAVFALAQVGPPGRELVPASVEAMGSTDSDVRWAAGRVLAACAARHDAALRALLGLVTGGATPATQRSAVFALRLLEPRLETSSVLIAATRDDDISVKRAALSALASGPHADESCALRLQEVLASDADLASRALAAVALGEFCAANPAQLAGDIATQLEAAAQVAEPSTPNRARAGLRRAAARALARLQGSVPSHE